MTNLSIDLMLLATASHFDLSKSAERKRSVEMLEDLFCRILKAKGVSLFMEIGANDAAASLKIRSFCPSLKMIAFEANPYVYEAYKDEASLQAAKIDYRNLALSNTKGSLPFHVITSRKKGANKISSLHKRRDSKEAYEKVRVKAATLDQIYAKERQGSWAAWIDVEGSQAQVLLGGRNALREALVIIIEVEDRVVWEGQWLTWDVDAYLTNLGFTAVARDFQANHQYNVLYWKTDLLHQPMPRRLLTEYYSELGTFAFSKVD